MQIKGIDVLVTKLENRESKRKEVYQLVNVIDIESGNNYTIINKNRDIELSPMTKYKVSLHLQSYRQGLVLSLKDVIGKVE